MAVPATPSVPKIFLEEVIGLRQVSGSLVPRGMITSTSSGATRTWEIPAGATLLCVWSTAGAFNPVQIHQYPNVSCLKASDGFHIPLDSHFTSAVELACCGHLERQHHQHGEIGEVLSVEVKVRPQRERLLFDRKRYDEPNQYRQGQGESLSQKSLTMRSRRKLIILPDWCGGSGLGVRV